MKENPAYRNHHRLAATVTVLILAVCCQVVFAGSAGKTRPSGSDGTTTAVSGRASYGYGGSSYYYYPSSWYGGYYNNPFLWYGGYGGYGWYGGPRGYPPYRSTIIRLAPGAETPALIETDLRPKKAHLFLDGEDLGKVKYFNGTWDRLMLPPGVHKIEFRAKGYRTLRLEMEAEPGQFYRLDYKMEKGEGEDPRSARLPSQTREQGAEKMHGVRSGLIAIRVLPGDAAIYLDGEFLGRGDELSNLHGALPVAVGSHRIQVVRPGYKARNLEVDVSAEETLRLELNLEQE